MIIYLGGASGSGKSYSANQVSANYNLNKTELDPYYDNIQTSFTVKEPAVRLTQTVCDKYLCDMLTMEATGIIEGGWIKPSIASQLQRRFKDTFIPIYFGYSNDSPQNRLNFIKNKGRHWLRNKPTNEALAFIANQITESKQYEKECSQLGLKYFDFSNSIDGNIQMMKYIGTLF
jgi:hypothetical protein